MMKLWMDVMRHIEHVLDDHERLFDAWEAGGVDGLVLGPLQFGTTGLLAHAPTFRPLSGVPDEPVATFDPDPAVYRRFGVTPPPAPAPRPALRRRLDETLMAAKERGWQVWIFLPSHGHSAHDYGHIHADEQARAAVCARVVDTLAHYPMADGGILDGWPEWGHEITPGHRRNIVDDLPASVAPGCAALGYDYAALAAARDRLFERLHALDPARLDLHARGGWLGAGRLFDDPDLAAWMRFRVESLTGYYRYVRAGLEAESSRPVKLGCGTRTAAFAPLSGFDLQALAGFMDLLLPKHYFFHRGFDGMVGTVGRYVDTLTAWNPGLDDAHALAVVGALFGLQLPGVECREDLEEVLLSEDFGTVVATETARALAASEDAERIVPWVDSGRAPHDGDPIPAGVLRRILRAAGDAGLRRFVYCHHENLTPGEWTVISQLCGTPWSPRTSDYRPPDAPVV